jgi:DNA-directed RNA polymerase specialized sigma24 family protein
LAFAPRLDASTDADIRAGLAEAKPEAFHRFFDEWFPRVYALAWRELQNRPHAEAVTRRSLRRALEEIGTLDPATPLAPWLLSVVRAEIDWARRATPP